MRKPKKLGWGKGAVSLDRGVWRVRWREAGERRSQSGFGSRSEAEDELKRIHARLELGQPALLPKVVVKPRGRGFAELLDEFIEHRKAHKVRSASEDRARWLLHLAPALEPHTIDSLTPKIIRGIASDLVHPPVGTKGPDGRKKKGVSGPTAHRCITLLSAFYTWLEGEEMVTGNPARIALRNAAMKRLLRSEHDGKEAPFIRSWGDVDRLYEALVEADRVVSVAYYLSARAGLRPGEVIALRWRDVDLEGRFGDGPSVLVERQARKGYEGPPKSGKARRVPLTEPLVKTLTSWRGGAKDDDLVCPPPPPNRKLQTSLGSRPGSTWIRFLHREQINAALTIGFEKTRIAPMSFYEAGRHSFGSISGLNGISTWRLKEVMGHSDIKTTERYVSLRAQALTETERAAFGG